MAFTFTNSWGFADKSKGPQISAGIEVPEREECWLRVALDPVLSPYLNNENASAAVLHIQGDYEPECSSFMIARLAMAMAMGAVDTDCSGSDDTPVLLAYPSAHEPQRDVMVILPVREEEALVAIIHEVREKLGLLLSFSGDCDWQADTDSHLQSALLFSLLHHALDTGWFRLVLPAEGRNQEQLANATGLLAKTVVNTPQAPSAATSTNTSKTLTDCDAIKISSLSLGYDDGTGTKPYAYLAFTTLCYRLLAAAPVLQASQSILAEALQAVSSDQNKSWDFLKEGMLVQETLRRLRSNPSDSELVCVHDGASYELSIAPVLDGVATQTQPQPPRVAEAASILTPLEKRSRKRGFLLFVPSDADSFAAYWQLRCGTGLGSFDVSIPASASASASAVRSNPIEASSQDSLDSLDSLDSINGAAVPVPASAQGNSSPPPPTVLRVAPVPSMFEQQSVLGRQLASRILPLAVVSAGITEVPYLTRSRSSKAVDAMRKVTHGWRFAESVELVDALSHNNFSAGGGAHTNSSIGTVKSGSSSSCPVDWGSRLVTGRQLHNENN